MKVLSNTFMCMSGNGHGANLAATITITDTEIRNTKHSISYGGPDATNISISNFIICCYANQPKKRLCYHGAYRIAE